MNRMSLCLLLLVSVLLCAHCGGGARQPPETVEEPPAPITNRIDVPPAVRRNLGITFVDVAYRQVARTRRVPGSFELLPGAHAAYHATMAGQIQLAVEQYQRVKRGDLLLRIESPGWRALQLEMAHIVNAIRASQTKLTTLPGRRSALDARSSALAKVRDVWQERLAELERLSQAGAGNKSARTEARAALSAVRGEEAEILEERIALDTEEQAVRVDLLGHRDATPMLFADALGQDIEPDSPRKDLVLSRAAALLGMSVAELTKNVGTPAKPRQRWRDIEHVEVRARSDGVVEALSVTTGAWVHVGDVIVETVDPTRVRFRGIGLQADLEALRDGMAAWVVPPGGKAAGVNASLEAELTLGLEADPLTRKIDLILVPKARELPHWARHGVSTEAEVTLMGTSEPQLAIPTSSVIRDGLEQVIFRRDPKDPDKVIRLVADLGISDGRWIVLESGVMEGDQVVDHGIYELMLAGSSAKQEGGHFHADGTWHAGSDH